MEQTTREPLHSSGIRNQTPSRCDGIHDELLRAMEPETEVVVSFVGVAYREILTGNVKSLATALRVDTIIVKQMCRLYAPVETYLIPVTAEEEEWT